MKSVTQSKPNNRKFDLNKPSISMGFILFKTTILTFRHNRDSGFCQTSCLKTLESISKEISFWLLKEKIVRKKSNSHQRSVLSKGRKVEHDSKLFPTQTNSNSPSTLSNFHSIPLLFELLSHHLPHSFRF